MAEQECQGGVEGQWSQLGRGEDLLEDQELVWRLDKVLLLVFVRKVQAEVGDRKICTCKLPEHFTKEPEMLTRFT